MIFVRLVCIRSLVVIFFFVSTSNTHAMQILGFKWFDKRTYYLDLRISKNPKGETAKSLGKGSVFSINAGYYGKKPLMFPIGKIITMGMNQSVCTLKINRGSIWQAEEVGIGWNLPEEALFVLEAGPILIHEGKIVHSYQGFKATHWNRVCIRNIVGLKGNRIYFFRFEGSLWECAKYLKKKGFQSAINLDGGSSCAPNAKVVNAIVVLPKTSKTYQDFKGQFDYSNWTDAVMKNSSNMPR